MNTKTFNRKLHHFSNAKATFIAAAAFFLVSFAGQGTKNTTHRSGRLPVANNPVNFKMSRMPLPTSSHGLLASADLKALNLATGWINSKPLSGNDLKGKVILINFWTYTCINWLRTLPHVRAWSEKYQDKGLVVIGVHTPEFSFEQNIDNVRLMTKELRVAYPVAVDNEYDIWNAFDNHYWPALYFIDAKGKIRHQQFGEGDYERSEEVIQQLLKESGAIAVAPGIMAPGGKGIEAAPDWISLKSQENYLGFKRTEHFASRGGALPSRPHVYSFPGSMKLNQWALSGDWSMGDESVLLNKANGKIRYSFHARDLHMVMGPQINVSRVRFRVLVNGHAPGADHGMDIDENGYGTLKQQRLYQLVRQKSAVEDCLFEIEFLDKGAEAFSFTFG